MADDVEVLPGEVAAWLQAAKLHALAQAQLAEETLGKALQAAATDWHAIAAASEAAAAQAAADAEAELGKLQGWVEHWGGGSAEAWQAAEAEVRKAKVQARGGGVAAPGNDVDAAAPSAGAEGGA